MIVLDTNVVSEPLKLSPASSVVDWLDRQRSATLYLAAPSLAELLVGIEFLPAGQRRERISERLVRFVDKFFESRILSFDADAAKEYAALVGRARSIGRAISVADGQIAAIARSKGFKVATRDVAPFETAGVPVIDPWTA